MHVGLSMRCDVCGGRLPLTIDERPLPGGINPDVMVWSDSAGGFVCGQCRAALAALTGVLGALFARRP